MSSDERTIRSRLAEVRDELATTEERLDRLRSERDKLIRQAAAAGLTRREIAHLSGTSHQRVTQVVNDE
jgi:hypothetical protein